MCWLFPVCVPINFASPEFQFRRAVCRVNWSRGLSNWFSNHILWKFMSSYFFLCLFALAIYSSQRKINFHQWSSTPTTYSFSLFSFHELYSRFSLHFIVSVWAGNWNFVISISRVAFWRWTRAQRWWSMYINGIMDLLTFSRFALECREANSVKSPAFLFINRCEDWVDDKLNMQIPSLCRWSINSVFPFQLFFSVRQSSVQTYEYLINYAPIANSRVFISI